jgi:large-conductance mechanosensitive channel
MKKRMIVTLSILCLVALLFSACGAKGDTAAASAPMSGGSVPSRNNNTGGFSFDDADGAYYDKVIDAGGDWTGEISEEQSAAGDTASLSPEQQGLKIIYTAYAELQTEQFQESYDALMSLLSEHGGYVQNSTLSGGYTSTSGYYYNRYADLSLRIPADHYKAFLDAAGSIGTMTSLNEYTEDITSVYIDTEARLKSLEMQEKRLLELLENAEVVTDLIEIESKLGEVRYRIESYQSQMNTYENLLSYSTVTISLQEVTSVTMPKDTFGQRVLAAIRGSGDAVVDFFDGFVIALIYILPFLLIALVILLVVLAVTRKRRAARKERASARKRQQSMQPPMFQSPYATTSADETKDGDPVDPPETDGRQ